MCVCVCVCVILPVSDKEKALRIGGSNLSELHKMTAKPALIYEAVSKSFRTES
jgi:hypothetical protein